MLSAEAAKARLEEFAIPQKEATEQTLARVKALPTPVMRAAGFGLLGRDAEGRHFGATTNGNEATRLSEAARTAAGVALDETLTDAERLAVFGALLPGLAAPLAAYWTDNGGLYQTGYARRAFRAPNRPDLTRVARLNGLRIYVNQLEVYADRDSAWLATWAGYISGYGAADYVGRLLAQAIDLGGPEGEAVFETLIASGNSEHEIGAMGRHVTRALLCANRPDGWAWAERLLLAAQRQEGLRQAVLEAVDEAHPEAFHRMIGLIRAENLLRFSSAVRAADVWFGFGWTTPTDRQTDAALGLVGALLDDPEAARAALIPNGDADGQTVYLALWTLAFHDALDAVAPAGALLHDTSAERRFAAAHFLADLQLPESKAALLTALDDGELAVAARAFQGMGVHTGATEDSPTDRFDVYVRNLPRFPKPERTLGPIVWPWMYVTAGRERVANALVAARGARPLPDLLPYLGEMDSDGRAQVARLYADPKVAPANAETRAVLLRFMSDASSYVRELASKGLEGHAIGDDAPTITGLETLLTRKSGDTRRTLISMLLKQDDAGVLASAGRLMAAKPSSPQRAAGLDLLTQMVRGERSASAARDRAVAYARENPAPNETESALLDELTREDAGAAPTLDDALGLMNPAGLTPAVRPEMPAVAASSAAPSPTGFLGRVAALVTGASKAHVAGPLLASDASLRLIHAVDEWVEQHRESPINVKSWQNDSSEVLLGSATYYFPTPNAKLPISAERERLPLFELWEAWWKDRPADLRDADSLEAVRANVTIRAYGSRYSLTTEQKSAAATLFAPLDVKKLRHERVTTALLSWSARLFPADIADTAELQIQGAQATLALMPAAAFVAVDKPAESDDWQKPPIDWRYSAAFSAWLTEAQEGSVLAEVEASPWTDAQITRLWNLLAWRDRPFPGMRRYRPTLDIMLSARRAGAVTDDDLYDLFLGLRQQVGRSYGSGSSLFSNLNALSGRKDPPAFATTPGLKEIVARCRARITEVELKRGDTPTAATPAALALRYAGGTKTLLRVLAAFGKTGFARGGASSEVNRAGVFSHLIRATFPGPDDTIDDFVSRVRAAKIGETRLIETALYAPQWARHIEAAIGWPLFAEGVWWLHAHTKDDQWAVDKETREAWTAEISDKTPLTAADLVEGGVDVAWFGRVYGALGAERWNKLDEAAKFASSSGGHKRAQLFAGAMLGDEKRDALDARIANKRHGDAVRALGLLPLPEDEAGRQAEALLRYQTVQEFRRTSRQFGAQRQESEKKAARIGLENLARTAGYADPARLEWAMEAHAVADLQSGPLTASSGDVTVTLSINGLGAPVLEFAKKGKALKALPAAAKKDPAVAELIDRRVAIERQAKRMRASLEEAMCRGDVFAGAELARLWEHPVLQPFLQGLVFLTEATETEESRDGKTAVGYLVADGTALETLNGETEPLVPNARVRVAHPYDLFDSGAWEQFQHDCFRRERIQPFKQVFRELYLLTENEQEEGGRVSRRYAGHQVNPSQAVALMGKRGWVSSPDEGVMRRSFHAEGLSASVEFVGLSFTPADVEGLTIEHVQFTRRGEWRPIPLSDVPPRVFSEAMRDVDLVVSVAHQGGVDPEASASTVEMRAALVREAAQLLHLDNVRLQRQHVLIDGALGTYSVHLGSAIVHRQPGGFLCIVPVHSQHRGRLFLPFADDDPRTAEVVSKVLLLAKDQEIKDPTILEQILAVH